MEKTICGFLIAVFLFFLKEIVSATIGAIPQEMKLQWIRNSLKVLYQAASFKLSISVFVGILLIIMSSLSAFKYLLGHREIKREFLINNVKCIVSVSDLKTFLSDDTKSKVVIKCKAHNISLVARGDQPRMHNRHICPYPGCNLSFTCDQYKSIQADGVSRFANEFSR